ncbi:MAG: zinc-ribbon domain-containing protein [Methanosarcinaceae archaeon]|nr:zinc-ribbon domain-containing protein [Methanosarcinaceae archaeon]
MFCTNCGKSLEEDEKVCPVCRKVINEDVPESTVQAEASDEMKEAIQTEDTSSGAKSVPASEKVTLSDTTVLAILAVINLLLCWPFTLIMIVLVFLALNSKTQEEADRKAKYAKWCGFAGIGLSVIIIILYIIMAAFLGIVSTTTVYP